jgi:pimeloyl-ACP methyl ester carboxylesterase
MTEFLDAPGGRIAYDVNGSGPLVVLSHGIGDRRQAYRFLAPMLAQAGYRVANADLRGHGESSMGWASITRTDVAGDLLALIGHLGGPAVIVGHSLSGGAATIAAATRPEQVSGIVEINPFTRKPKPDLGRLPAGPPLPPVRLPADRHAGVPQPAPVAALPQPGLPGQARRPRRLHGRAGRQAA